MANNNFRSVCSVPQLIDNLPKTEVEAVEFITKAMEQYQELKYLSNIDNLQVLLQSINLSYEKYSIHRKKMCAIMMEKQYVEHTSDIIENLQRRGYFSNSIISSTTFYAYNILWNFCDFDQDIATAILGTRLPNMLIANILNQSIPDNLANKAANKILLASVSIVYNVIRHPGNQCPFDRRDVKDVLVKLIKLNNSFKLGLISMLTLSVLVDESELELLEEGKNTISCLINYIKTAHKDVNKRYNGFLVWELVNGLRCISANDDMKKAIVRENGIQVLLDVLETPSNDDDVEQCLGAIWNLCFDNEIKSKLDTVYNIKTVIKRYENHQSLKIRKNYEGILWSFSYKSQSIPKVGSASDLKSKSSIDKREFKFDIFFSYAHADQDKVFKIRDEFLNSNLKVWIDVNQMQGSVLEAMAEGIEDSRIFIMAVSEAYRISPNCRSEAEYAYKLKKTIIPLVMECKYKPTSWLGLIMSSKLYYGFSERTNCDVILNDLLKSVIDVVNKDAPLQSSIIPSPAFPTYSYDLRRANSCASLAPSNQSKKWSKEDVKKWLTKSQLSSFVPSFSEIDGVLLDSMIEMSKRAPDYFYQTLKSEFELSLIDILRLNVALKDLSLI